MTSEPPSSDDQQNRASADNPDQQFMFDAAPTQRKSEPAKLIRRADWGAKPPKWIDALATPVKKVVLTWTETEPCHTEEECKQRVREIQEEHMKDAEVPDIKHNFLVGGDGGLYEGRGYTRVGPKYPLAMRNTEDLTGESIEIAFIQKHADRLHQALVEVIPDCVNFGINGNYIEREIDFLYIKDGQILNRQHARTRVVNKK